MKIVHLPLSAFHVISPRSSIASTRAATDENIENEHEDIHLRTQHVLSSVESSIFEVPPATPCNKFGFSNYIGGIKRPFPSLDNLKIPYVREIGIKASIETLSVFFSCPDYKLNALQFWFLDVITDCLWKMQDEYHFPEPYQKIILGWVLYVFDFISDPRKNLTRKEFFQMFNEAIMGAHEKIQTGCEMLPLPHELYNLELEVNDEQISFPLLSSLSSTGTIPSGTSYIVNMDENTEIFELPKLRPKCYKYDDSIESLAENVNEESLCKCEDSIEFYQPDLNTPDRFIPSSSSSSFESVEDECHFSSLKDESNTRIMWKRSAGATPNPPPSEQSQESVKEWENYLEERTELVQDIERNIMINSCALSAIKDFIYDYFYETFQFTIVKMALMNHFNTITQYINREWHVPKFLREELKKPKIKKEKKKKKKKPKKKAPRKKTKRAKDKKKKKKGSKKSKKPKKPKKKKLTKEEKAELARLKREQQRLEEELRRKEENRRLLFPLNDATDDEFFKSIFDHYKKRKKEKKKKAKSGTRRAT